MILAHVEVVKNTKTVVVKKNNFIREVNVININLFYLLNMKNTLYFFVNTIIKKYKYIKIKC